MSRGRAITTRKVFASVMEYPGAINPPSVPATRLELMRLYVGENRPRISDTGLLCDDLQELLCLDKVREDDEGGNVDNEKAHAAQNIGQRSPAGFIYRYRVND